MSVYRSKVKRAIELRLKYKEAKLNNNITAMKIIKKEILSITRLLTQADKCIANHKYMDFGGNYKSKLSK